MNTSANADNKLYALYTSLKAAETLDQVSALLLAANTSALLGANEYAFFQEMLKRYAAVGSTTPMGFWPPNEAIATTIFAHYRLDITARSHRLAMRNEKKRKLEQQLLSSA